MKYFLLVLVSACLFGCDNSPSQQYRDNRANPSVADSAAQQKTDAPSPSPDSSKIPAVNDSARQ